MASTRWGGGGDRTGAGEDKRTEEREEEIQPGWRGWKRWWMEGRMRSWEQTWRGQGRGQAGWEGPDGVGRDLGRVREVAGTSAWGDP